MADWTPMTDEQRQRWKESGLFPVERWKTLQRYFDLLRQIDNAIHVEEVMKALASPKDGAPTLRHTLGAPANCPACKAAAAGVLPSDKEQSK